MDEISNSLLEYFDISKSTTKKYSNEFKKVLTTKYRDSINNLEVYELLGDSTLKICVSTYAKRQFPYMFDRKIFYGPMGLLGKHSKFVKLHEISKTWSYFIDLFGITKKHIYMGDREEFDDKMKENIFEALIGCTRTMLMEENKGEDVGYYPFYRGVKRLIEMYDRKEFKSSFLKEENDLKQEKIMDYKSIVHSDYDMIIFPKYFNLGNKHYAEIFTVKSNKFVWRTPIASSEQESAKKIIEWMRMNNVKIDYL